MKNRHFFDFIYPTTAVGLILLETPTQNEGSRLEKKDSKRPRVVRVKQPKICNIGVGPLAIILLLDWL